jgi:hypothetical protein
MGLGLTEKIFEKFPNSALQKINTRHLGTAAGTDA